jgi:iron(III) transport system ATP-binding protein
VSVASWLRRWQSSGTNNRSRSNAVPAAPHDPGQPTPTGRVGATFAARLTFEKVERQFDNAEALRGISLVVEPGEVVCLLGPSGCGKTTLLRIASGIERPTGGRVLINDREVAGPNTFVPPERRNVGLMFQDFALFPHLTILANVAFGLRALPRDDAHREALAVLARVGLTRYANAYPHTLSGGEQQRVALARAIVPRPAVMLMDEPFSGLDVQLRDSMQAETMNLLRETRATCLIVTHDPQEALRLANRIAIMRDGRLIQAGRAAELYRNPASLFVARLFSEINELKFRVIGGRIATPFGDFSTPELNEGDRAVLCLSRLGVRIAPNDQGRRARVLDARFLGDLTSVEIAVEGLDQPLTMLVREGRAPPRGAEIAVTIDPTMVMIFPEEPEPASPIEPVAAAAH